MFKKIVTALLLSASLFGAQLHWAKDYQSGMAQAKKEHKPVLFVISSHSCKYCLMLDSKTLKDKKVAQVLNKSFVIIRSWTDKRDYIPDALAQHTPGLPGIWFLLPNGEPMFQPLLGYAQKAYFLKVLTVVKKEFNTIKKGKK